MNSDRPATPLLGFAGFSGTGKTTLLTAILPMLRARGLRVGLIKHAHHDFDIDHPGKDSFVLRKAGANPVLVASARRWALMVENDTVDDPKLDELVKHLDHSRLDLILVEGFKHELFPKVEVHRPALGHPLLCTKDPTIIAVAIDAPLSHAVAQPLLDLNRPATVAAFIVTAVMNPDSTGPLHN